MARMRGIIFITSLVILRSAVDGRDILHRVGNEELENFDYRQQGADWGGTCSTGQSQSPIDIIERSTAYIREDSPITFVTLRDVRINASISTHSIALEPTPQQKFGFQSRKEGFYKFDSAHFHWPAEHLIDGKRSAFELHMIFYKERYSSVNEAVGKPRAVVVIGVLYDYGKKDELIGEIIESLSNRNQAILRSGFDRLFPEKVEEYWEYEGSLTTPPCTENVVWVVDTEKRTITRDQVNWFKTVRLSDGSAIESTYRNVQNLNGRRILRINTDDD